MVTVYSRAAVPNLFGIRDQFRGRQFSYRRGWGWGDGSGGNASDGGPQMKLRSLARRSPLTSCCAARFLTGQGLVPGHWGPLL